MNKQLSFWNETVTQSRKRKKKTLPLPKRVQPFTQLNLFDSDENTQLELPIRKSKKRKKESRIKKNKRLIPEGLISGMGGLLQ